MDIKQRKLPVGIQSFEKIRENGNLYVDKTEFVFRLVHTDVPYFLSRPRRFGKSLLLSTLKAYREGRRDLFKGLRIGAAMGKMGLWKVFLMRICLSGREIIRLMPMPTPLPMPKLTSTPMLMPTPR